MYNLDTIHSVHAGNKNFGNKNMLQKDLKRFEITPLSSKLNLTQIVIQSVEPPQQPLPQPPLYYRVLDPHQGWVKGQAVQGMVEGQAG